MILESVKSVININHHAEIPQTGGFYPPFFSGGSKAMGAQATPLGPPVRNVG